MGVNDLEQVTPATADSATPSPSPAAEAGATTPDTEFRIKIPEEPPETEFILADVEGEPSASTSTPSPEKGAQDTASPAGPAGTKGQDPVPYDRFAAVYGRMKGLERQLSQHESQGTPAPSGTPTPSISPTEPIKPRPEESSFETYDAYIEALADWKVDEKARTQAAKVARENAERSFHERLVAGAARMPGFETKAYIPEGLGDIVIHSELAAELAYYWGENEGRRAEAIALLDLPPIQQAYRIAQLEAQLKASSPPRKQTTQTAFPAMKHVDGVRESGGPKAYHEMTPSEYIDHMNKKEGIPYHD